MAIFDEKSASSPGDFLCPVSQASNTWNSQRICSTASLPEGHRAPLDPCTGGVHRFPTVYHVKPQTSPWCCYMYCTYNTWCVYIYVEVSLFFEKKWYPKNKPSNYKIIYSKITMLTWGIPEVKKPSYIFIQFISMVENTIEYQLAVYIWWIMVKNATSLWLPAASSWNQL